MIDLPLKWVSSCSFTQVGKEGGCVTLITSGGRPFFCRSGWEIFLSDCFLREVVSFFCWAIWEFFLSPQKNLKQILEISMRSFLRAENRARGKVSFFLLTRLRNFSATSKKFLKQILKISMRFFWLMMRNFSEPSKKSQTNPWDQYEMERWAFFCWAVWEIFLWPRKNFSSKPFEKFFWA